MQNSQANKMGIFNVLIIIYNFITTLINSFEGYVSYISIAILVVNLLITITSLKKGKTTSEIICLIFEIITALIIVFTFI